MVHEEDDVPLSFPQNWAYGGTGDAVRSSPIPMGSSHTGRQTRTTRMAPPPLNFSMSPSAQGSFSGSNSSVTEPLATTSTRTESDDPFEQVRSSHDGAPPSAEDLELSVAPSSDRINMFGSLQVSTNYSVSGTVRLKMRVPYSGRCEVRNLGVSFTGYAVYMDSSGRYACTRVCDIRESLQQQPMHVDFGDNGACESDFDLFVPGWLPATFNARYSSTFYAVQASATVAGLPVHSEHQLVILQRSRELVPIPVAQMAIFNGAPVEEAQPPSTNPFRSANPFRVPRNPFIPELSQITSAHSADQLSNRSSEERAQQDRERLARRVPLRHFAHSQQLVLPDKLGGGKLPLKITLSVPSHTHTTVHLDEGQPPLLFGVQIELDDAWQKANAIGGLRLRELEAMCVQMEKYATTPSRSYCTAFALTTDGEDVPAAELPRINPNKCRDHPGYAEDRGIPLYPYNMYNLRNRLRLERAGAQPSDWAKVAERFQSHTVGPQPQSDSARGARRESYEDTQAQASLPTPQSKSEAPVPRRKRVYSGALSRLSSIAAAIRDNGESPREPGGQRAASGRFDRSETNDHSRDHIKASYEFDGRDGLGLELTKKRERLSFSLPLTPSSSKRARALGVVQLLPDYESPHVRIRHKLKVKLTFAFGDSGSGVQNLVLCVPARFTEAPANEALAQASPIVFPPAARSCVPADGSTTMAVPAVYTLATRAPEMEPMHLGTPYLPAYAQLFREDGSRLGDDLEELPQYPDAIRYPGGGIVEAELSARLSRMMPIAHGAVRDEKTPASTSYLEAGGGDMLPDADDIAEIQAQDDDMMLLMDDAGAGVVEPLAVGSTEVVTVGEDAMARSAAPAPALQMPLSPPILGVSPGMRDEPEPTTAPPPPLVAAPPLVPAAASGLPAPALDYSMFRSSPRTM